MTEAPRRAGVPGGEGEGEESGGKSFCAQEVGRPHSQGQAYEEETRGVETPDKGTESRQVRKGPRPSPFLRATQSQWSPAPCI